MKYPLTIVFSTSLVLAALAGSVTLSPSPRTVDLREPDWPEILGPSQADIPSPLKEVLWRTDMSAAMGEAKVTGRPLFVTMRCLPCKQCSEFDADVLEGGPQLNPLLKQFITVRLTSMTDVDLRLFPVQDFQDLDLSWWGWMLSPDGRIYSVFGGRDHVSDKTRISLPALEATLRRVLDHHYDLRRRRWDIDGSPPDLRGRAFTPNLLDGWDSWYEPRRTHVADAGCIHCHQVMEIVRQPALDEGTFDLKRDLGMWPLPENVGITLDRDHGLRVTAVEPGSAAARAGVEAGDVLAAAEGRRLFGQTDFRAVLHRAQASPVSIDLHWLRDDAVMRGSVEPEGDWRATNLNWRTSVSQGNIGAGPGFWPNRASPAERRRHGLEGSLALRPWFGPNNKGPAWRSGVRNGHIVTSVNGERPDLAGRAFLVWFRLQYKRGDVVTLTVLDNSGNEREITYRLVWGEL